MRSSISNLSTYALACICFLGAFTRFTYGKYTPTFYAFQQYHQQDDGTAVARVTPIVDTIIGCMLLMPRLRFSATLLLTFFFTLGLVMQVRSGKEYMADVGLVGIALSAMVGILTRERR
ncbi:hypothetical protein GYMLUDRAFT_49791 [Collybiopsis luxurians FD-317 M1]|uniref:Uncharacterized protein n=1 Tax=Collybiopsis luxurians FD-317 M1 TaxID=944289 RepID=A0A0D0AQX6_9AGAR|nr:hypothetical protein GYMLUDRAFT_49791 [Collybiopsis luxurians FD-317 M1]